MIASVNLMMSSVHHRWLTMRETLTLQGFPSDAKYTYNTPCSSYALRTHLANQGRSYTPWPSRRQLCHQAGNSMHVTVSGLVLLFCLTQVEIDNDLLALQEFQRKRRFVPNVTLMGEQSSSSSKRAKL